MGIEIKDRVAFFLRRDGLSQEKLSNLSGVSQGMISSIITGKKKPGYDTQEKIIKALGVTHAEFFANNLGGDQSIDPTPMPVPGASHGRPIPVISWVTAGKMAEAIDCWPEGVSGEDEPVFARREVSWRAFALRVKGDSMEPRYMAEDIIVVDPEIGVSTGDPCVAKVAGDVTFKIYYENGTEIRLKALNPKYPDMVFLKDGAVDFCVVGKVVELIAKI